MKYELNHGESIFLLAYICYVSDGLTRGEASVLSATTREFLPDFDQDDAQMYFDKFDILIDTYDLYELIDFSVSKINRIYYKKLLVYLVEGVLSDGKVTEDEADRLLRITNQMGLDSSFYRQVADVFIEKYYPVG